MHDLYNSAATSIQSSNSVSYSLLVYTFMPLNPRRGRHYLKILSNMYRGDAAED